VIGVTILAPCAALAGTVKTRRDESTTIVIAVPP